MDFKGKKALVTGASSGIGEAAAILLAKEGADVIVMARSIAKLEELKKKIEKLGRRAEAIACDVADDKSVAEMAKKAL